MAQIKRKKDTAVSNKSNESYDHLALSGLEYNPFATESPGVFSNPIYDAGRGSIYIWVARLIDNAGRVDSQGNVVRPPITSASFDTDHIVCMRHPVVPAETLATYFAHGRLHEGDTVLLTEFSSQHLDDDLKPVVIGGVASRLALHSRFPVQSRPKKDDHPRGA
jgi:hypothetical protein